MNKCEPLVFAGHCLESELILEERNKVLRWKMKADLDKFGGSNIKLKERNIPYIKNPYEGIDWATADVDCQLECFKSMQNKNFFALRPKVRSVDVNNFEGIITVLADYTNKIQWLDDSENVLKTKYNNDGKFLRNH